MYNKGRRGVNSVAQALAFPFQPSWTGPDGKRVPLNECNDAQVEAIRQQLIKRMDHASTLGNYSAYQQLQSMLTLCDSRLQWLAENRPKPEKKKTDFSKIKVL